MRKTINKKESYFHYNTSMIILMEDESIRKVLNLLKELLTRIFR
jgi:hypothetical protein